MAKYRSTFRLDDPHTDDGDIAFVGIDQLTEPSLLEQSKLQESQNARIVNGTIQSRGGLNKLYNRYHDGQNTKADHPKLLPIAFPDKDPALLAVGLETSAYFIDETTLHDLPSSLAFQTPQNLWTPYQANGSPNLNFSFKIIQAFDEVIIFPSWDSLQRPHRWGLDANGNYETQPTVFSTSHGIIDKQTQQLDTGFFACPRAPFGLYFQNRLIIPHYDDTLTSVAFSDILEPNVFKRDNVFSLNQGSGDQLLGLAPYLEDQVLALCRESIHIISGVSILESGSRATEISRQFGIAGIDAWTQNGSYIYFMSNEGEIQVLVPQLDSAKGLGVAVSKVNLDQEPLSKNIPAIMERVNISAVDTTILHYHKNLVYIALPLDGATRPSHIVIYDSLRSEFVSLDSFDEGLEITDIQTYENEVYLATRTSVMKYSDRDDDYGYPINFKIKTRNYLARNYEVKKFTQGRITYDFGSVIHKPKNPQGGNDLAVGDEIIVTATGATLDFPRVIYVHTTPLPPAPWIKTGDRYIIQEITNGNLYTIYEDNDSTKQRARFIDDEIYGWGRDSEYKKIKRSNFKVSINTESPASVTEVKNLESPDHIENQFNTFNISQRGQVVNATVESTARTRVTSLQVHAFVQNARYSGDYS